MRRIYLCPWFNPLEDFDPKGGYPFDRLVFWTIWTWLEEWLSGKACGAYSTAV